MNSRIEKERGSIAFMHSSNEMYGADKILLEVLHALPEADKNRAVVWLPTDLPVSQDRLSRALDDIGVDNEKIPIAVLRRRYLRLSGVRPLITRLWTTYRNLMTLRPDVVYCTTSAMVLCLPLARMAKAKSVVLHVQEIWSPREAILLGLFARGADRIFCISSAVLESLPEHLKSRADLLVNAHRESELDIVPVRSGSSPLRFVVASRWNAWKGHRSLLTAWDSEVCPGDLIVLGGPPAVGEAVDVSALAERVRHGSRITVIGEVEDITPHIDAADFLILPSEKPEPFGLVLLEAFARGRGVIATEAGGVLDVVRDGVDGRLYPIGQSAELVSTLKSLNRTAAIEMGRKARATYEARFSIEAFRSRFQILWSQLGHDADGGRNA